MAVDKLVDSTQLDADLTTVANAIRTKGGTSAQLAFPAGFASAIAAIPTGGGGLSNVVTGTFTGTTTGAAMDVTLNYTGSGYPIACIIYPDGGVYNNTSGGQSNWYSGVNQYSIGFIAITKCEINTAPEYLSWNVSTTNNRATLMFIYKSSSSSATAYSKASYMDVGVYHDVNATGTFNSSTYSCVKFRSNQKMSVFIRGSSNYGFMPNIEYKYWVIYSS